MKITRRAFWGRMTQIFSIAAAALPGLPVFRFLEGTFEQSRDGDWTDLMRADSSLGAGAFALNPPPPETGPMRKMETVRTIAVLPFRDLSPERDQEYLGDGIAEEIMFQLSRLKGVRITAETSVFALKGSSQDVREIGARRLCPGSECMSISNRKAGTPW